MYTDQGETTCGMSCTQTSATILIAYLTEPLGPNRTRGNVKLKNGKQCVIVCNISRENAMQNAIIYASLHHEKATNENRKPETEIIAIFTYNSYLFTFREAIGVTVFIAVL